MFKQKQLDYYKDLTSGQDAKLTLTQDQACVVLKAYDYGVEVLNEDEIFYLNQIITKLKNQIWP